MEMNRNESLSAIEALEECVHAYSDCASHDIREGNMAPCALICLDCADICAATLKVMARHSSHHGDAKLCAHICRQCAMECAKHPHEHCKQCAAACEKCATECDKQICKAYGLQLFRAPYFALQRSDGALEGGRMKQILKAAKTGVTL